MNAEVSGRPEATVLDMGNRQRNAYRILRKLLRGVFGAWFRFRVVGMENVPSKGAFILAAGGHRSILDTPAVSLATPSRVLRYMGADTYFNKAGLGTFLRAMGGFPVQRAATDRAAMRLAELVLQRGEPLVIFPEGTRQTGPVVTELKQGAAFLACRQQVPILPIGIGGAERALPKGARVPRPRRMAVVIGEPLYPPDRVDDRVKRSSIVALSDDLRNELQRLYDKAQIQAGA